MGAHDAPEYAIIYILAVVQLIERAPVEAGEGVNTLGITHVVLRIAILDGQKLCDKSPAIPPAGAPGIEGKPGLTRSVAHGTRGDSPRKIINALQTEV